MENTPKIMIIVLVLVLGLLSAIMIVNFRSQNETETPAAENGIVKEEEPCSDTPAPNDELQEECVVPPDFEPTEEPTPTPVEPTPAPKPQPQQPTPAEINRGDTSKNQVIFTFDGGAGSQSLSAILSTLKKHSVKGTFFVTGKWAEANRTVLQSIAAAGHEVFNHTYSHPNLTEISDAQIINELAKAEEVIKAITNKTTKPYFRPPFGARNQHVLDVAWSQSYQSVYWTIDALDWQEGATAESVKKRILDNVSPGTIYLMHIGDDITGQILDSVFTTIKDRGYKIVSLTQGL